MQHDIKEDVMIMLYTIKVILGILLLIDLFLIVRVEIHKLFHIIPIYSKHHEARKWVATILSTILILSAYF